MKNLCSVVSILFTVFLCGCAATPAKLVDLPESNFYRLKDVQLTLQQKQTVEGYPDEAQLLSDFSDSLSQALATAGVLAKADSANAIELVVKVNYNRHFAGEDSFAPSKSVVAPTFDYTYEFYQDDGLIDQLQRVNKTVGQSFFANLKTVATAGLGNDAEKETADIDKITRAMAAELTPLLNVKTKTPNPS